MHVTYMCTSNIGRPIFQEWVFHHPRMLTVYLEWSAFRSQWLAATTSRKRGHRSASHFRTLAAVSHCSSRLPAAMTFVRTLTTALTLLLALTLSPVVASMYSTAPACTTEQETTFAAINAEPDKCSVQSMRFESCDDDCLAALQSIAAKAPNCTIQGEDQIEKAGYKLRKCEGYRLMPSNRYIPKDTPGLRNCTLDDKEAWENSTGYMSGFSNCNKFVLSYDFCSAECLASIESTILAAPPCIGSYGYSLSELGKATLVACLKANRLDLQENAVLQSVATSKGTAKSDGATKTSQASASLMTTTVAVVATVTSVFALVL